MEAATPYQLYALDCPYCAGVTLIGDQDPSPTETCADCGEEVEMSQ